MRRPWGIHAITDIYSAYVHTVTSDGRFVRAVAEPYSANLLERGRAAWWVLTGRAQAVVWPVPGDLEKCLPGMKQS